MTAPQFRPGIPPLSGIFTIGRNTELIDPTGWVCDRELHRDYYYHAISFRRWKAERGNRSNSSARACHVEKFPMLEIRKWQWIGKWRVIPGRPVFLGCKKPDLAPVSWESDEFHTLGCYVPFSVYYRFRHKPFFPNAFALNFDRISRIIIDQYSFVRKDLCSILIENESVE